MIERYKWSRTEGYEVSSIGDSRFSAMVAKHPSGRTIEAIYQCDVKGYEPGGWNWKLGKGKPPLDRTKDMWAEYLRLWLEWARENRTLLTELKEAAIFNNYCLRDTFAKTDVNQARALAFILNYMESKERKAMRHSNLKKHVMYMRDSDKVIVSEGRDIFDAGKRAGIADMTKEVDFYTDPHSQRFVREGGKWVKGDNPVVDDMVGGAKEKPDAVVEIQQEE